MTLLREFDETLGVSGAYDGWVMCALSDGVYADIWFNECRPEACGPWDYLGYGSGKLFSAEGHVTRIRMFITDVTTGASEVVEAPSGKRFSRAVASKDGSTLVALVTDDEANDTLVVYRLPPVQVARGGASQAAPAEVCGTIPLPHRYKAVTALEFLDGTTLLVSVHGIWEGWIEEATYLLCLR